MATTTDVLGTPLWSVGLSDYVSALAWSPDGRRVAAGSLAGESVLVDAATGAVAAQLPVHTLGVLAMAWTPDGARIATGGQDGLVRIHRADGTSASASDLGAWVAALAWRSDGTQLAAGAGRVLRVIGPDGEHLLEGKPATSTITDVAWAVNKRRVAAASYGGVGWYAVEHGPEPVKHFAWKGSILCLAPSPDGRWLTVGAQDNTVHIWRLWSADELEMNGYPTKVEHLAWHHASRWMAVGNLGEITLWDFAGRGPGGRRPQQIDAHTRSIAALAFQPRGALLASGSRDGTVAVWDTAPKVAVAASQRGYGDEVATLAWSPDGTRLAVALASGQIDCFPVSGADGAPR